MIDLLFLGDLCLAGTVESYLAHSPRPIDIWAGVRSVVGNTHIIVANLENSFSKHGKPQPFKYATLRVHPSLIVKLDRLDVAILGNNHISDYGSEAAADTIEALRSAGIGIVGYGEKLDTALQPLIMERDGVRLGFLSYSCLTTNGGNIATPLSPGVAPLSLPLVRQGVESLRPVVDGLFVYLHWGVEQHHYPVLEQMRVARRIIDWGADAIIGSHAHVVQPYELYRGRHIFYGLGNFLFGDVAWSSVSAYGTHAHGIQRQRPANRESIAPLFKIDTGSERASVKLLDVKSFSSDHSFVPRPMPLNALSINWTRMNYLVRIYAYLKRHQLLGVSDIAVRAVFGGSKIDYYYASKPINQNRLWRLRQLIRRSGKSKGQGG